ncbi:hypothetical protein H4R18_003787 [Coemansia javaensis]|uniref:Acid phosphatase n=1 Tax=Coemansia javaensis TaxID=2761396 RepID=A0A9W8H7L9_9FUNG|nr:hypothetical protein H4R18_003787 [Coemansia javaensis]
MSSEPQVPERPAHSHAAVQPDITPEFVRRRYPPHMELVQAQVFFRHGERTPVSARLTRGFAWMHCARANVQYAAFMRAIGKYAPRPGAVRLADGSAPAQWTLRVLTEPDMRDGVGNDGGSGNGNGNGGSAASVAACELGQLTDTGLDSLHAAGDHLRRLYVERLALVPRDGSSGVYVRTTDYTRVVHSACALLGGLFPAGKALPLFDGEFLARHPIYTRPQETETMHGNFGCANFVRLFAGRSAGPLRRQAAWIDAVYRQTVALPGIGARAKQILDTPEFGSSVHSVYDELASLAAHGEPLPDGLTRAHLDLLGTVSYHHWVGPMLPVAAQRVGFGPLFAEITRTMDQAVRGDFAARMGPQTAHDLRVAPGAVRRDPSPPLVPRLALYGSHDITIVPLAHAMGYPPHSKWIPYAATLAFELLRDTREHPAPAKRAESALLPPDVAGPPPANQYVRVSFNNSDIIVPTCAAPGKHHPELGPAVCTLAAFYEHMARVTPSASEMAAECSALAPGNTQ